MRFAAANKGFTTACLVLVFIAAFVAQVPNAELARKIGVEQTFADMLISSLNSGNSFSAAWCVVPLISQVYLSYLFSQNYSDNFVLRWRYSGLIRVGRIIDALMVSIATSLLLIASIALIFLLQGGCMSNFSNAHSLLSYYAQGPAAHEPDAWLFVMVMSAYALLAVSTMGQFYILLKKFIDKDAVVILLLLLVGCFQLYSGNSIRLLFGDTPIAVLQSWNPLSFLYTIGDVGYASWLVPSFHRLLPMLAVLFVLSLLNGFIPEKPRRIRQ